MDIECARLRHPVVLSVRVALATHLHLLLLSPLLPAVPHPALTVLVEIGYTAFSVLIFDRHVIKLCYCLEEFLFVFVLVSSAFGYFAELLGPLSSCHLSILGYDLTQSLAELGLYLVIAVHKGVQL